MPETPQRLTAVVEKPLYDIVRLLAERDGVSLSQEVRDLIRHALVLMEDTALEAVVRERKKNPAPSIPLSDVKRRLRIT